MRAAAFLLVLLACAACGKTDVPRSPAVDLVVADPAPSRPPVEIPTPAAVEVARVVDAELPPSWTAPAIPKLAFADAMQRGRAASDAFTRLPPPHTTTADTTLRRWFIDAYRLADHGGRMYAAAYRAEDASREGRIDAVAEAAELALSMSRRLDDAGLLAMPAAWKSDPAVASTFEDVAVGPTRRFREEARVLARACIDTARELAVETDAARRCAALKAGPSTRHADGGTCGCSPGDPLCTSLGGWCD